jgi:hypothetical protein
LFIVHKLEKEKSFTPQDALIFNLLSNLSIEVWVMYMYSLFHVKSFKKSTSKDKSASKSTSQQARKQVSKKQVQNQEKSLELLSRLFAPPKKVDNFQNRNNCQKIKLVEIWHLICQVTD